MRNGLQIPNMPQQPPQMVLAQPINDIQLVALVAGEIYASQENWTPELAVGAAVEIVAEAVVQGQNLPNLIRQKRQALEQK